MTRIARSVAGIPIRLTDERWNHIIAGHKELSGLEDEVMACIQAPIEVRVGKDLELLAIRRLGLGKILVVVYREVSDHDGFILTAYVTSRERSLMRRVQLWP